MPLLYLDSSALVKLVRVEPESEALTAYLEGAELVSCELALAEVPRAIRRAFVEPIDTVLTAAEGVLEAVALVPVDRPLLLAAGAFAEPALRALDAIHIAAAIYASPIDAFVSYDERQAAVARLAGLRTTAPGAGQMVDRKLIGEAVAPPDGASDASPEPTLALARTSRYVLRTIVASCSVRLHPRRHHTFRSII